jgi:hypothetical protein
MSGPLLSDNSLVFQNVPSIGKEPAGHGVPLQAILRIGIKPARALKNITPKAYVPDAAAPLRRADLATDISLETWATFHPGFEARFFHGPTIALSLLATRGKKIPQIKLCIPKDSQKPQLPHGRDNH